MLDGYFGFRREIARLWGSVRSAAAAEGDGMPPA